MFTLSYLLTALTLCHSILVSGSPPPPKEYIIWPKEALSLEDRNVFASDIKILAEDGRVYRSLHNKKKPLWKWCTAKLSETNLAVVRGYTRVCIVGYACTGTYE